jgi:glucose/arabinose dehydrogenase
MRAGGGTRVAGVAGAACLAALPLAGVELPDGFEDSLVVSGLSRPTAMTFLPDGRLLIAEQQGRLRIVHDRVLLATPFLTLAVDASQERGLLGVAADPRFPAPPDVYVFYSRPGGTNRLSRFTVSAVSGDVADPSSERVLLDGLPSGMFHNGGALHFVSDGTLLLAVGDATAAEAAQARGDLRGKLLRLAPDGGIPPDNPFVAEPGARPEVWALGLRNPFTFAVEAASGRIFINDVGERSAEEINSGVAGSNYGWPLCEGACGRAPLQDPLYSYSPRHDGCAITGGTFARGLSFPTPFDAGYFFSDYCGAWIRWLSPQGRASDFAQGLSGGAVDLDAGPDGALYCLVFADGSVHRIEFIGAGNRRPVAKASAVPASGLAPLDVMLSALGSADPEGEPLRFAWDAGDGTPAAEGQELLHRYSANGPYVARLTVSDPRGGRATASVRVAVGQPPAARILAPAEGARFRPGSVVELLGEGSDPETGPLAPATLVWSVEMHHHAENSRQHHVHPFAGPLFGAQGAFEVPTTLHDDDIFFRVRLTVTDPDRLTSEAIRDVRPAR